MASVVMNADKRYAEEKRAAKSVSWKKRVLDYLKEAMVMAAPAILMMNGGYYRPYDK